VTELPVSRLRDDAVLPTQAYVGDAGLDLAACERVELPPGERALVGTGLAVAIPAGYAGFVQPRSGLAAEHGITILNSPGLIDSGYRGELRVVLHNTDRATPFVIERGMRIAQLVVVPIPEVELAEVDELPESERGVRGFGSSEAVGIELGRIDRSFQTAARAEPAQPESGTASGASELGGNRAADPGFGDPPLGRAAPSLPARKGRARLLAASGRRSQLGGEPRARPAP
jgi:dUTP pyrophosphatase